MRFASSVVNASRSAAVAKRTSTDGEELKRWFPLDARVTPGEGGKIWVSWGEGRYDVTTAAGHRLVGGGARFCGADQLHGHSRKP
jgi:hypothetical protein